MESIKRSDRHVSRYETPRPLHNGYAKDGLRTSSGKEDNVYGNGVDDITRDSQQPRLFGKCTPLNIHSRHSVVVSAIEDVPLVFSVQLVEMKRDLERLMAEINRSKRLPFTDIPHNGCICLGRKSSDGLLYRSVIMGIENTNSLKLYHVDYGTTELVPFCDIYQIETRFLQDKIYANRFTLQGLSAQPDLWNEIKDIFSKLIADQTVELEVVPPEGPPIVQYCNLYIRGQNVKDMMSDIMNGSNSISTEVVNLVYEDVKINVGGRHDIVVSYIDSIEHFYVHLLENKEKLDEVMTRLNIYCDTAPALSQSDLEVNMPCAAMYTEDSIWYRGLVVSVNNTVATVRYIDYGNCEDVEITSLKYLSPELITALEAQAIHCSLTGLDCIVKTENTTAQLEMLCLEKTLWMIVADYNQYDKIAVVDLTDNSISPPLNVSKRIIELSTPRLVKTLSVNSTEDSSAVKTCVTENSVKTSRIKVHPDQTALTFKTQISTHINRNFVDKKSLESPVAANTYQMMDVSEKQKVLVSWFINPLHFYCQLKAKQTELTHLMRGIQKHYAKETNDISDPAVGTAVIVKYQQDSIFYRGTILEKKSHRNYVIDFIDYGFKNVVQLEDLYSIREQFLANPKMAIRCKIQNILPNKVKTNNISQAWDLFKKEQYDCTFYSKGPNDSMLVDLTHNGENISSQLIEQGFAIKAEEEIKEAIEFPLLCGQTVRCNLLGMVDFNKFFVRLQGTTSQIECSLYNWELENTADLPKLKKTFCDMMQEQNVILYINDVRQSKLFVTLYDAMGTKIHCFSTDDLYPIISPLCPKTIFTSDMSVYISHVEPNRVFIQDENDKNLIFDLLEGLYSFYEQEGVNALPEPCEGSLCAAKSAADQNWYRALITQISNEGVLVKYIDYGNSELLQVKDLRELHQNYYVINELCLETIVDNGFNYDSENAELFNIRLALIEEGWKINFKDRVDDQNIVESNVIPEFEDSKHDAGYGTVDTTSTDIVGVMNDHVVISHVDSPGQFWVQYQTRLNDLHVMHTRLQAVAEKLPSLTTLQVGAKCIARYSIDSEWYRAEVLDADDDITTVRFIDYGNTDVINNVDNIIREIDGDLKTAMPYAKKCSLMAVPIQGEEWDEEACREFDKFVDTSDSFIIDIVTENEKWCYVNLLTGDRNICDELLLKRLADNVDKMKEEFTSCAGADSDVTTQKRRGYISHIVDLKEFYVQLECDRAGLEYLEEAFENAASFPPLEDPVEDIICVAQYSDDQLWYRAAINKEVDGGFEVFFIDFGNTAITSEIRSLPESVDNIGQLAKHCSLFVPDTQDIKLDAAKKLQELSGDGATIFEIEFVSLNPPYAVHLYINGENILSRIC